jgi:hypothetical protein
VKKEASALESGAVCTLGPDPLALSPGRETACDEPTFGRSARANVREEQVLKEHVHMVAPSSSTSFSH